MSDNGRTTAARIGRFLRTGSSELAIFLFWLSPVARKVSLDALTYLSPSKLIRLENTLAQVKRDGVAGDVFEFGVALGGSAIVLAHHLRNTGRRFVGFDVFKMIPPPTSPFDDDKSRRRFDVIRSGGSKGIRGGKYYGYEDNLIEKVRRAFAGYGLEVDGSRIVLEQGLFEDTVPAYASATIAFAHLDCDWYDPVKYCLEFLAPRMSVGGAIVLDDYNDYGGCRTAVDRFLEQSPNYTLFSGSNPTLRRMR